MVGRVTASAIASASRLSFLFDLTYGFTHWGQLRDTGHQVMPGQALAIHDVAPVIHSHCVKHALGNIDPEDVHFLLHRTRLLWLKGFTDRELIVAHCRRSAQGRVHFITTCGHTAMPAPRGDSLSHACPRDSHIQRYTPRPTS